MATAEIITIGTELLLGEISDTNGPYIARQLGFSGLDVFRTTSIGDNKKRIAQAVREALQRADIIITTGGLGPTVDDPTREAVAEAFNVGIEFRDELWEQVIDRFARFDSFPGENNKRQAYIPEGAVAIENPVGTAPAFKIESEAGVVICLPGVPREMEYLLENDVMPYLRNRFHLNEILKVRILHTAGVGESRIDERISDLEALTNPTVGLAAHSGQVDVRITAKALSEAEAKVMIEQVEKEVRRRLGNWIYGADEETLESIAMQQIKDRNWNLVVVEAGLGGKLLRRFAPLDGVFLRGEALPFPPENPDDLLEAVEKYRHTHNALVGLGVALYARTKKSDISLVLITPNEKKSLMIPYGGPPKLAPRRAVNLGMNILRKTG